MKYLITLYAEERPGDWTDFSPDEMQAMMKPWEDYGQAINDAGVFVAGEALQSSPTATTLRLTGEGERVVTDGPFAETKEQLGGFYLLECESLDEAIDWAKKIPKDGGSAEIRPVVDFNQFSDETTETAEAAS
jgi:hypothetical protein